MTTLATPANYKKEYLPGYTGHVPSKNERFGATTGNIKRDILYDNGRHPITLPKNSDESDRLYSDKFVPKIDKNKEIYSNLSRYGRNWQNGPNHMIRKQQVPGYTGHIKGLISENLFSKSYGNSTAQAHGKKHPIGHEVIPGQRFMSQNTCEYKSKNFRRFIDKPTMKPRKDYDDYTKFINDTFQSEKEGLLCGSISHMNRTGGFMKMQSPMDTLKTQSEKDLSLMNRARMHKESFNGRTYSVGGANMNDNEKQLGMTFTDFNVKPKLLESKVASRMDFAQLSDGFKRIFSEDKKDQKLAIPISGYAGHKRGDRSQNFFGKSFREQSLQSKKLQRELSSPSNHVQLVYNTYQ